MTKSLLFLFFFSCCYLANSEKIFVCYYGTWAIYRSEPAKFSVDDIDTSLCTHLMYAFAGILSNGEVRVLDPDLDLDSGNGNFRKFTGLKEKNPNLKTILSVGGWNEGSANYSIMVSSAEYRQTFIRTVLELIKEYNFDGLDFDWEYPNQRDTVHGSADVENFVQLLKELREEFDKLGLTLSAAVGAKNDIVAQAYDIAGLAKYLHFINLMTYDLHGPAFDNVTNHAAALHKGEGDVGPREDLYTVDVAVEYWLDRGCPPEKIILGLPVYGKTYTLANASENGLKAPVTGAGLAGPYSKEAGTIIYNELCVKFQTEKWDLRYDSQAEVPYAVQDVNWISYDDVKSLVNKVKYGNSLNLGGAMVWSIEADDFQNLCGDGTFPLLKAITKALGN